MKDAKYRADHIGSFLRPPELMQARRKFREDALSADELHAAENKAIDDVIKMQRDVGVKVYTDGEFRRMDFRSNFIDAIDGLEEYTSTLPWHGDADTQDLTVHGWYAADRLNQKRRITEHETAYLKEHASGPVKVTIPSVGFLANRSFREGVSDAHYKSVDEITDDLVAILRSEIEALIAEGVEYIQLDNPGYGFFLDEKNRSRIREHGGDPDAQFDKVLAADVASLAGIDHGDTTIGLHLCRGNFDSRWLSEGGYDAIAEKLFNSLPVDRFLLEYDDARSGGFEPLRFMPDDKMVVLGLISSKSAELEDKDAVLNRVDEAAEYVSEDNLAISPQCGFASVAEAGNRLTMDDQKRKLELVGDVAIMLWGFNM